MQNKLFNLSDTDIENLERKPNLNTNSLKQGYNFQATNFIVKNIAKKNNAVYLDTEKCFKSDNLGDMHQYLTKSSLSYENVISGEVPVSTSQTFLLSNILLCVLIDDINKKLVIPLTLMSDDKENHAIVLYADKNNDDIDITILEQHAHKKGDKDYNKSLDFSREIQEILSTLKQFLTDDLGFDVKTHINEKPICREKNVCGIVALELCSQILSGTFDNQITFTKQEIEKFHKSNINLYKKHSLKKITDQIKKTDRPTNIDSGKTRD